MLMVIGALLVVIGLLLGVVWGFSRAGRRAPVC